MSLYKNGAMKSAGSYASTGSASSVIPFYIGAGFNNSGYFLGNIDDVAIYNRVLTQTEIAALYNRITTSIVEQANNSGNINVYPNPSNNILNIECNGKNEIIKIIDMLGSEIQPESIVCKITSNGLTNYQMSIANLPNGIYFVKAGNKVAKFIHK